jgi:NADH:ubiquinone oxidoreductase subunit 6 (subunit J)
MKNNKISYINNTLSKNYFFSFSIAAIIILLSIIITYRTKIFILLRFFIEFMETFFQTLITYATMMTSIEKDIPNINTTQDTM